MYLIVLASWSLAAPCAGLLGAQSAVCYVLTQPRHPLTCAVGQSSSQGFYWSRCRSRSLRHEKIYSSTKVRMPKLISDVFCNIGSNYHFNDFETNQKPSKNSVKRDKIHHFKCTNLKISNYFQYNVLQNWRHEHFQNPLTRYTTFRKGVSSIKKDLMTPTFLMINFKWVTA